MRCIIGLLLSYALLDRGWGYRPVPVLQLASIFSAQQPAQVLITIVEESSLVTAAILIVFAVERVYQLGCHRVSAKAGDRRSEGCLLLREELRLRASGRLRRTFVFELSVNSSVCRLDQEWKDLLTSCFSFTVRQTGAINDWMAVADKMPHRTNKDCRKRWSKVCATLKKGPWSSDEDSRLQRGVNQHGCKWTLVAQVVESRSADRTCTSSRWVLGDGAQQADLCFVECAKRWQHSLDPHLDRSEWKPEEDRLLLEAVRQYGMDFQARRHRCCAVSSIC